LYQFLGKEYACIIITIILVIGKKLVFACSIVLFFLEKRHVFGCFIMVDFLEKKHAFVCSIVLDLLENNIYLHARKIDIVLGYFGKEYVYACLRIIVERLVSFG